MNETLEFCGQESPAPANSGRGHEVEEVQRRRYVNAGIRRWGVWTFEVLTLSAIMVETATLSGVLLDYLPEMSAVPWVVLLATCGAAACVAVTDPPAFVTRRRWLPATLAAVLWIVLLLPLSAIWPGGITHARYGLTVVGLYPVPALDVRVSGEGTPWFYPKSHRVTARDVEGLASAGVDRVIIGSGWEGAVRVDGSVHRLRVKVEVLKTPEAIERYKRLKREGLRVALILHSTC
ncbi:MAG: hypothetical protein HY716_18165 [Planctomycetes bacterium]|nr:hypothetical protein [Planctomycetota bacterium]